MQQPRAQYQRDPQDLLLHRSFSKVPEALDTNIEPHLLLMRVVDLLSRGCK